MPCTTVTSMQPASEDSTLKFGYGSGTDKLKGLLVQSLKITNKVDKKELMGSCGTVLAMHYYNRHSDIEISGLGIAEAEIGTAVTLSATDVSHSPMSLTKIIIDEVSVDMSNDDFAKSTIKATAYEDLN